jgi:signal transduction histidine kinase
VTRRLLLSYLGLALLVLLLLELPLAGLVYRYERDIAASQAERVATGIAIAAGENFENGRTTELQAVVERYREETGGEIEIIGTDGKVVADFDPDQDNDATGQDRALVTAAAGGASVSAVISDEGQPLAEAAVPIGDAEGDRARGVVLLGLPARATLTRIHDIWWGLAIFAGTILVMTASLGLVMARSLARPLKRLQRTVEALGQSDLTARAATDEGPGEIRELARQFNQMAARLGELVDAQARFVADASHQLRSPLTALRLRLENLEIDTSGPPADTVTAAGREVQRLSRLVDGLLTLGQAERVNPERHPVDLLEVIEERCRAWTAFADERHVELHQYEGVDRVAQAVLVPGDLEQILDNLLANALDASPAGTRIAVGLDDDAAGSLTIHIRDEGPGMTEVERQHAFDRFWQGQGTSGGHSGLGLAIVRHLALRNQIDVQLRPAEGGGLDAVVAL